MQGKLTKEKLTGLPSSLIRLNPAFADPHSNLGAAFYRQRRTDDAIGQFRETLGLKPDHADARRNLDAVLAAKTASSPPPGISTNR